MAKIHKITMYVCDLNENLSVNEMQDMIDDRVLNRISTNGFCLLQAVKSVETEWSDEHSLNYHINSNNPDMWEKVLNNG